ncbi:MAG: AbrB/MazE/SpoVT family DNA-binding domain-containing protein [Nitrospira sp.]|nr:AbrB/MazE/SpoVT family DNA-binding domain-containing protein [Nitrospira sp.]
MPASTITSKGQITIPKEIRDHLHIKAGDKIDFILDETGKVVFMPVTSDVRELKGFLHRKGRKAVSVQEMNKAVKDRFKKG